MSDTVRKITYETFMVEAQPAPIVMRVEASSSQLAALDSHQLLYLLLNFEPPEDQTVTQLPLNLSLVVDRSTSMQGTRLDFVKAALEILIDKLGADDVVSLISFSDRADVVVPAGPVVSRQTMMARAQSIRASGGTEILQGLRAAVKQVELEPLEQYTNHLILLTDGHTYGDADECLQFAEAIAARGIGISAFGIGNEWNDQFLDRLVVPSGGQSDYIEQPSQLLALLQERIHGLGATYARNVHYVQENPPGVFLKYGFKLAPYTQRLAVRQGNIKLGDVEGRTPLSVLLEFTVAPQVAGMDVVLPLSFRADIPSLQMGQFSFGEVLEIPITADAPEAVPPPALINAVRMLNMYRINERIWEEVDAGNLDRAATRLRHLTTRLMEAGEKKLAEQALLEAERLSKIGTLSLEGRKRIKYGTRAMLTQMMEMDSDDTM